MFENAISLTSASRQPRSLMHRRSLLISAGAAGMVLGTVMGRAYAQIATAPDCSLRIAPLRLELAPGKVIEFSPKPTGTRWYHSHDVAGTDLRRSLYSGMYGFLIAEERMVDTKIVIENQSSSAAAKVFLSLHFLFQDLTQYQE